MEETKMTPEDQEEESPEQIRILLKLSSLVKNRKYYELSSTLKNTEIAVPSSIRRKGLSLLVNHLLSSDNDTKENDDDDDDDEKEEEKEERKNNISFDFLLNNKLLRTSLEISARRESIYNTFEECIVIEYFPSYNAPTQDDKSDVFPDWIYDMSYYKSNNKNDVLVCGCYDGSIKLLTKNSNGIVGEDSSHEIVSEWTSYKCHDSGIKCVDTISTGGNDGMIVVTGGLDHTLKSHVHTTNNKDELNHTVEYVNGHCNTIESVALQRQSNSGNNDDKIIVASGDWDGGLCLWNIPTSSDDNHDNDTASKKSKLNNNNKSKSSNIKKKQQQPMVSLQAHTTNISNISFSNITPNHMITSSYDYSLKLWDIQQQDCLVTLNGSRVITSFDVGINSDIVVTTHPDCTVRLWDLKSSSSIPTSKLNNDNVATASMTNTTFKPSHKGYVSDVQWSPSNPFIFATTSYDGTCKLWDIRSTIPLFTFNVCNNNRNDDDKALCLAFGNCNEKHEIYSAGTDCVVKQFSF